MLNCLATAIPGGERVVSAEEVFQLSYTVTADPAEARSALPLLHVVRREHEDVECIC
jgi:hypothetical protein